MDGQTGFDDSTRGTAATRDETSSTPHRDVVGPYRLIHRVGEGGMGEVWLAEQVTPVHRNVALKVIKAGMDTAQVVARFNAERQALAVMDHPAIARVYDGGATPLGRPYFVMEYVKGEPITEYCDRHKLPLLDRIELFIHLCEGVQHAHQKGIIHRDLKPSNVLITLQDGRPVPKIIDFGIAKATTHTLVKEQLHTEIGVLIGTVEYMSPEQADSTGLDVDTRTDVYALGVILYQLLTGELPFESKALRAKSLDEIRRTIREVDPPTPSTRMTSLAAAKGATPPAGADAPKLATQLRGDLDWITMKALEKDRTRRYGAASDLAADLRRYLDNQPVLASPPSTVYRLRKFVRRNRVAVAVAAGLVIFLMVFAVSTAVQAGRIARERDRANREAERASRAAATAEQVSDFLVGLFKVSDPGEARGNSLTAREILDKGADRVHRELADQPEVQAPLMETIGTVYTNLGLYRAAEPLLREAVTTSRRVLGPDHPQTLSAMNQLANAYWYQERAGDAEPLYRDVIERRRQVLGPEHADTLRAQNDLASLFAIQKRLGEAEPLAKQTLEAALRAGNADNENVRLARVTLQNVYFQQTRYADAEPLARQIMEGSLRRLGERHPDTLTDMHNLATVTDRLEKYAEAEPLYLRTIDLKIEVLGAAHPSTIRTTQRLATMYAKQKRYDEAEARLVKAYESLTAPANAHQLAANRTTVAGVVNQLVQLYDTWGQPAKAIQWRAKDAGR